MTSPFRAAVAWYNAIGLETKFALQVVLSTALLFAILLPIVLYIERTAILSTVEENGFRLTEIFARSSVQAVVADDYLVLQHVVNGISSEKRVLAAMLLKEGGEVLVHTRAIERGRRHEDLTSIRAAAAAAPLLQRYRAADGTRVYDFTVPVYVLGEKRATARVAVSIEPELAQIARTRSFILLLGLSVLGFGLVWAAYQARRITRPVQTLVQGARQIARGNLAHHIEVTTGDELGQLALAFNHMAGSVRALIETSRELSSSLDPDAVLRSVAAHARDLVAADLVAIAPLDRDAQEARIKVVLGARTDRLRHIVVRAGLGIGGSVLATGAPVVSAFYREDPGFVHDPTYDEACRDEAVISTVAVPITLKGDIIGLLWVANRTSKVFSAEDVDSLQRMASQAAIVMENARLYAETRLKSARLEGLLRVSQVITSTLDPERIVQAILEAMSNLMPDIAVGVWVTREGDEALVPLGGWGSDPGIDVQLRPGEGLVGVVAASRRLLAVEDARDDPRMVWPDLIERGGLVSFLGLPLLREDRLLGVFHIATRKRHRFTDDEIHLFESFAQQAAIALENARLYQDLKASHEELIAAQAQLVHKTRMAAMGEIAAVVAHEARNPLGALSNCVQLLRDNPHITGDDAELLQIVHTETQRLNEIVSDFLAFGRPKSPRLQEVDANELLEATLALLRRDDRCPASIQFLTKLDTGLPPLQADRDQLRQVFWNLFLNAVQAMGEQGELQVETRHCGDRAEILIRDTGPGISSALRERIFEPFFTTRADGTGLGLAIVHRIVQEHRGQIQVDSESGLGTCFALALPLDPRTA